MDKSQLLRLVADGDGSWWPDWQQKAQGRGCYLCLQPACLVRLQGKGFARMFGAMDAELLRQRVLQGLQQRMNSLLQRLRSQAQIGRDAVMQGLWQPGSWLILVAEDASSGLADRVTQAVEKRKGAATIFTLRRSSQDLGAIFDRDQVAVVGWPANGLTRLLSQSVQWLEHVDAVWH